MEVDRHGRVISYDIQYVGYDMNDTVVDEIEVVNVIGSLTQYILKGLDEYTEYEVSIRARTSAGPGPYSFPLSILTNESSRFI